MGKKNHNEIRALLKNNILLFLLQQHVMTRADRNLKYQLAALAFSH